MSLQRGLIVISFLDLALPVGESFEGKGVFFAGITGKLLIYGFLLMINSISFVLEAVWKGTQACYICGFGRGFSSSLLSLVQQHLLSFLSKFCHNRGECVMASQGEKATDVWGRNQLMEKVRGG